MDERPEWAERIQAERLERGWSTWDMARRLYRAVGIPEAGTSKIKNLARQVVRWETGRHFPRDWSDAYARALGIEQESLFSVNTATQGTPSPLAGTLKRSPVADGGDDDVKRRALLELVTALGAGAVLPTEALSTVLSGLDDALSERAATDLPHWESAAWEHARVIWTEPTGALVGDLGADVLALGTALQRETRPGIRRGLLRSSAEITAYMAQELSDMGRLRAARRCFETAIRAAQEAGDRDMLAWVRSYHASRAVAEDRPPRTVTRLIDDAVGCAGGAPGVGLATALKARAQALAAQGDGEGAENALNELRRVLDALPDSVTGDHISPWGWPEDRLRFGESHVYAVLGDSVRADAAIERALHLVPPERAGTRVNLKLMRALSLVREGEVAEGLAYAVESTRSVPSSTGRRRFAGEIIKALPGDEARTLPAARELRVLTAGV